MRVLVANPYYIIFNIFVQNQIKYCLREEMRVLVANPYYIIFNIFVQNHTSKHSKYW